MGRLPNGGWEESTVGDAIDAGSGITAYCADRPRCGRQLDLDVYDLAIWFGRTQRTVGARLPLKCSTCGGKRISYIHSAETRPAGIAAKEGPKNFRRSRTIGEIEALKMVFPQRERW